MKIHRFVVLIAIFTSSAFAQTNTFPASGNVGIGTTSPTAHLHIADQNDYATVGLGTNGPNTWYITKESFDHSFNIWSGPFGASVNRLKILNSGNVGIGTANPMNRLVVSSGPSARTQVTLSDTNSASLMLRAGNGLPGVVASDVDLQLRAGAVWTDADAGGVTGMTIKVSTGNVGIGTTNPSHKLAVNGTIKAKEVIVETTGWSDYVFADDYALAPLTEVEAHIKEHKHLPGIPSAAQVAENGVSIGDMQAKLLAKIEELTLHQIAQEKELAVLRTKVARLEGVAP